VYCMCFVVDVPDAAMVEIYGGCERDADQVVRKVREGRENTSGKTEAILSSITGGVTNSRSAA